MVAWGASLSICVWPTGGLPRLTQPRQLSTGASEAMPVSAACAMWPCKDPLLLCRQLSTAGPCPPRPVVFTMGRAGAWTWGDGLCFWVPSRLWVDGGEVTLLSSFLPFQTIMEQFNPSLRNFIAMGKNYEKALAGTAGLCPLAHRWTSSQSLTAWVEATS